MSYEEHTLYFNSPSLPAILFSFNFNTLFWRLQILLQESLAVTSWFFTPMSHGSVFILAENNVNVSEDIYGGKMRIRTDRKYEVWVLRRRSLTFRDVSSLRPRRVGAILLHALHSTGYWAMFLFIKTHQTNDIQYGHDQVSVPCTSYGVGHFAQDCAVPLTNNMILTSVSLISGCGSTLP